MSSRYPIRLFRFATIVAPPPNGSETFPQTMLVDYVRGDQQVGANQSQGETG